MDAPLTERDLLERAEREKGDQLQQIPPIHLISIYLWLCALVSRFLRGGVGEPCSVTLRTSRLFLSGLQRPWRVNMGESTRFLGGSLTKTF